MMINCPKCNLLQPKARHCVGCGLEIAHWNPKKKFSWKQVFGNWLFQVGVLVSIIFVVVLKDNLIGLIGNQRQSTEPLSGENNKIVSQRVQLKVRSFSSSLKKNPGTQSEQLDQLAENQTDSASSTPAETPKPLDEKPKTVALEKKIIFRPALINRKAIEELMEGSQRLTDNAFIVDTSSLLQVANKPSSETRTIGRVSKIFSFNQETSLFVGESNPDFNFGFFAKATVLEDSQPDKLRFLLQTSCQFKTDSEPSITELEVGKNNKSSVVIIKPELHEVSLNEEEAGLFESSQKLNFFNDENFQNEYSDIILVFDVR